MARRQRCFWILFSVFLLLGIFIRVWRFGTVPGGINQDEAFAGYEACSLLNYGVDSAGYRSPCNIVSWGSGMNVLESYLAASDATRSSMYQTFYEHVASRGLLISIGFEHQEIIVHRAMIRGLNANVGNPLYDFHIWEIMLDEENTEQGEGE